MQKKKQLDPPKSVPLWILLPVVIGWAFFVFKAYFSKYNVNLDYLAILLHPGQYSGILNISNLLIFKHLFNIFLALVFLLTAFGLGRFFLKWCRIEWFNFLEEIIFSVGLGLGGIAYIVFVLGLSGLLYSSSIILLIAVFGIMGFIDLKKNWNKKLFSTQQKLSPGDIFVFTILIIAALLNLIGALSPEIFYDSLVYHLGVPNYYIVNHKIVNMPYVFLSNLPAVAGMLFTTGLMLKDEIVAKLINYSAGLLCCLTLVSISIRYFKLKIGIWASLIFYTIVHVMISSWSCGTETILAFFSVLSVYAIMNYTPDSTMRPSSKMWLVLSAAFAGLSMAVKYTGLFVAFGIIISFLIIRGLFSLKNIRDMILFGFISAIIVSPWLIKNYVYKKNPVYPYLSNVFPKDKDSDYNKLNGFITEARQIGSFNLKNWLKHPWDITMGKVPNSENFTPIFLFMIPILFFLKLPHPVLKYGLIYSVVVWLSWSFSTTMIRFMMPVFPFAGLIIAAYLIQNNYGKMLKKFLLLIVLFTCLVSVYWAGCIYYGQGSWKVVFGQESKEVYLSATHPSYPYGYYAAAGFVNKNLPDNSKILFIGDGRSFYFKRFPVVSSAHDLTPIVEWAKKSDSAEELYRKLQKKGITHIYFNLNEAVRLGKSYRMFEWDEKSLSVYNDFWRKYVKQIFYKDEQIQGKFANRVAVYEILSEKEALLSHTPPLNLMSEMVVKDINPKK